jgi:hypothetical protein
MMNYVLCGATTLRRTAFVAVQVSGEVEGLVNCDAIDCGIVCNNALRLRPRLRYPSGTMSARMLFDQKIFATYSAISSEDQYAVCAEIGLIGDEI